MNSKTTRNAAAKERARAEAIQWQADFPNAPHSYGEGELADAAEYFARLGKRYGLLREYRENGII